MFPPKKPPQATSAKGAIDFLAGKESKAPPAPMTEQAGETDSVQEDVTELVTKYGKDAVMQAVNACDDDESSEQPEAADPSTTA